MAALRAEQAKMGDDTAVLQARLQYHDAARAAKEMGQQLRQVLAVLPTETEAAPQPHDGNGAALSIFEAFVAQVDSDAASKAQSLQATRHMVGQLAHLENQPNSGQYSILARQLAARLLCTTGLAWYPSYLQIVTSRSAPGRGRCTLTGGILALPT